MSSQATARPTYHKCLDGTRDTNYAQWRSREDREAMLHDSEAAVHIRETGEIAVAYEPHLYEAIFVHKGV